jgi:hypothetical protein
MTIHSEFWNERKAVRTRQVALRSLRDSNRQRCYDWENKFLRPHMTVFDRNTAKGYARLCVKIAIRQMRVMFPQMTEADADTVRASFKAAFTKETIGHCNANAAGAYFAKWGWTDVIIAHEVAHWADQWAHKLRGNPGFSVPFEGHGPRWRGWFVFLLSRAGMRRFASEPEAIVTLCRDTLNASRLAFQLPA